MPVVRKKQPIRTATTLPDNKDFHNLVQAETERKNPGGVWVDGWYIPPGINFGQPQTDVITSPGFEVLPRQEGSPAPTSPAPAAPKTPEQLMAEAVARANGEVGSNSDFLSGQASLVANLGTQLTGYDAEENNARLGYQQNKLGIERNRKDSLTNTANNLADRGLSLGGVAAGAETKVHEAANLQDLSANTNQQSKLSQLLTARANARSSYEAQREELRRKVNEGLVGRYMKGAGNGL